VVLASSLVNAGLERAERAAMPAYGERVAVRGGALDVVQYGTGPQTIVMLSGYGTAAPAIDFAPLIRELPGYRVVVVEGFGYGYSDTQAPPRTIQNITAELHEALGHLHVQQPYVLLGHSLSGIYNLYYANRYRKEVAAVIGIDASVPGQTLGIAGGRSPLERLVSSTGLLRAATTLVPSLVEPDGTAYTTSERERMRLMTNWNWANPAVVDEADHAARNLAAVQDLTFPKDMPVLSFIKKTGSQPGWRHLHERQLQPLQRGELVALDGGHYLHWTQSPTMGRLITQFLSATANTH
jgi:pimeloyl-ACP methyl ester carboxylesterase